MKYKFICILLKNPSQFTGSKFQHMYYQFVASGRIKGKDGLSGSTVRRIHNIVHQALEQEVDEDIIKNPLKKVVSKIVVQKEYEPYSSEELNKLLEMAKNDWLYAAIVTLVYTGIRRSELWGLKWSDIDFDLNF